MYSSNGYKYVFDKFSACETKKFWRCEQKNQGCKCRIHTLDGNIVKQLHNHSHDSDAAKVEMMVACSAMKIRAAETMEPTSQIINLCLSHVNLSQAAQAKLPQSDALKKMIRRKRNYVHIAPTTPLRVEDLVIPDDFKSYDVHGSTEKFLLADSGPEPQRILIFGREKNINEVRIFKLKYFYCFLHDMLFLDFITFRTLVHRRNIFHCSTIVLSSVCHNG